MIFSQQNAVKSPLYSILQQNYVFFVPGNETKKADISNLFLYIGAGPSIKDVGNLEGGGVKIP